MAPEIPEDADPSNLSLDGSEHRSVEYDEFDTEDDVPVIGAGEMA